jgi:hypothetical protein
MSAAVGALRGVPCGLLGVERNPAGMSRDMSRRSRVPGGACRRAGCLLFGCRRIAGGRVGGKGCGASLAYEDLTPRPSAGCFDGFPGSVVVRERILEVQEHALGAVGSPGSLCPAVAYRGFFGALLVAAVCHGYPSVRLQVCQGRDDDSDAKKQDLIALHSAGPLVTSGWTGRRRRMCISFTT